MILINVYLEAAEKEITQLLRGRNDLPYITNTKRKLKGHFFVLIKEIKHSYIFFISSIYVSLIVCLSVYQSNCLSKRVGGKSRTSDNIEKHTFHQSKL